MVLSANILNKEAKIKELENQLARSPQRGDDNLQDQVKDLHKQIKDLTRQIKDLNRQVKAAEDKCSELESERG